MAQLSKSGTPSLATPTPDDSNRLSGLLAGEAIAAGDACYVKSDGKAWLSNGTSANAAAKVDGFAQFAASSGEPVTLMYGVRFRYAAGMTPGTRYYLSAATSGGLADTATTGGTAAVAFAVDATRLEVFRSNY